MLLQESFPLTTAFFDAVHKYGFSNISLTDLESMTGNSDESLLFKSQLNFIHTTDHQNVEIHPMAYTHYSYLGHNGMPHKLTLMNLSNCITSLMIGWKFYVHQDTAFIKILHMTYCQKQKVFSMICMISCFI